MKRAENLRQRGSDEIKNKPSVLQLEGELARLEHRHRYRKVIQSTIYMLITIAAVAVLVATLWLPVLRIYGTSMSPTLEDGQIVVSVKSSNLETGDLIVFWYNNKILVKRLIAGPGDWVDISEDGVVSVNGTEIDEPYLTERALGECDIELPYQVPDSRLFVMGDHRSVSIDSRSSAVGCVSEEQIVGKIEFRVWPFDKFGSIK